MNSMKNYVENIFFVPQNCRMECTKQVICLRKVTKFKTVYYCIILQNICNEKTIEPLSFCKSGCFARQKCLYCNAKEALLQCKTMGII